MLLGVLEKEQSENEALRVREEQILLAISFERSILWGDFNFLGRLAF